jgi:hypothetical protein
MSESSSQRLSKHDGVTALCPEPEDDEWKRDGKYNAIALVIIELDNSTFYTKPSSILNRIRADSAPGWH